MDTVVNDTLYNEFTRLADRLGHLCDELEVRLCDVLMSPDPTNPTPATSDSTPLRNRIAYLETTVGQLAAVINRIDL